MEGRQQPLFSGFAQANVTPRRPRFRALPVRQARRPGSSNRCGTAARPLPPRFRSGRSVDRGQYARAAVQWSLVGIPCFLSKTILFCPCLGRVGADLASQCGRNGQKLCPGFGFFAVIRSLGRRSGSSRARWSEGLGKFGKQVIYQLRPDSWLRWTARSRLCTAAFLQQVTTRMRPRPVSSGMSRILAVPRPHSRGAAEARQGKTE